MQNGQAPDTTLTKRENKNEKLKEKEKRGQQRSDDEDKRYKI